MLSKISVSFVLLAAIAFSGTDARDLKTKLAAPIDASTLGKIEGGIYAIHPLLLTDSAKETETILLHVEGPPPAKTNKKIDPIKALDVPPKAKPVERMFAPGMLLSSLVG